MFLKKLFVIAVMLLAINSNSHAATVDQGGFQYTAKVIESSGFFANFLPVGSQGEVKWNWQTFYHGDETELLFSEGSGSFFGYLTDCSTFSSHGCVNANDLILPDLNFDYAVTANYLGGKIYGVFGNENDFITFIDVKQASTPVPATVWLFGSGLAALIVRRRNAI